MKTLFKHLLRLGGYRPARLVEDFASERSVVLASRSIDLVVDIGANTGQYGRELRKHGYLGSICSFEPQTQAYSQLQGIAKKDRAWVTNKVAIGERVGTLPLNIAGNSVSSSMFPMLARHSKAAPTSQFIGTELVDILPLDDLWGTKIPRSANSLLKIDTQGYEASVIRGAQKTLTDIQLIECELSLVPLYQGQPLFHEMYQMITQLGFTPVSFDPSFFDKTTGLHLQVDGLFARG